MKIKTRNPRLQCNPLQISHCLRDNTQEPRYNTTRAPPYITPQTPPVPVLCKRLIILLSRLPHCFQDWIEILRVVVNSGLRFHHVVFIVHVIMVVEAVSYKLANPLDGPDILNPGRILCYRRRLARRTHRQSGVYLWRVDSKLVDIMM